MKRRLILAAEVATCSMAFFLFSVLANDMADNGPSFLVGLCAVASLVLAMVVLCRAADTFGAKVACWQMRVMQRASHAKRSPAKG